MTQQDYFDNSHVLNIGEQGSLGPAVGAWDMVQQNFRQQYRVDSAMALDQELSNRFRESLAALSARGQNFNVIAGNPYLYREFAQYTQDGVVPMRRNPRVRMEGDVPLTNYEEGPADGFEEMRRANEAIRQLGDPRIKTFEQILQEVSEMQRGIEEETASMSERASGFANVLGFGGTIAGSFTLRDPLNVMTAPVGWGRTVATRIGSDMLVAGGTTAITEYTDVMPNRALAGLPERDPLLNIAAATIGGGLIRGGIEGAGAGYRALRSRLSGDDLDFDLRDAQLQQMFADNSQSPSVRGAASLLNDTIFLERNNPFGEGYAASERFIAELRAVQRSMNGEAMTAVGRVLPPVPVEEIRRAADFEIVREQAPDVYARLEEVQTRLADIDQQIAEAAAPQDPNLIEAVRLIDREAADQLEQLDVRINDETAPEEVRVAANIEAQAIIDRVGIENISKAAEAVKPEPAIALPNLQASRKAINQEYQAAYNAVEAESVRLRDVQVAAEAAQQTEASNILAQVSEGRPFVGPLLRYDNVLALVERINAFNDTLDEATVARFAREVETGRADWQMEDGRVDIGLREPVDPDFRIPTDEGELSVMDIMRDLQDDVDLVDAIKVCSI